ncbi:hypothetical protein F4808DRAFT_151149 [Astrocystis sublimbata]|nr:hypothetical protein F4808DRAFT_151149 [Astrocystis sublimbata]
MSLSKQRISSPLEAGRSILDANLPPHLVGALEYASKRLARKNLNVSLIVVKNEHQLPSAQSCAAPISPPQTPEPSASGFASPSRFTSPVVGLRHLVRRGTNTSVASTSSTSTSSSSASETTPSKLTSPTFPTESINSPRRWILPLSPLPSTPMTPHTPSSIATITSAASSCATSFPFQNLEPLGIRLVHTSTYSSKDERIILSTINKAERKFHIGAGGLPTVTTALACGLCADIMQRSIEQNEILFSSEGLTLLGLDRLYSFKAALCAYATSIGTEARSPGLSNHPISKMPPTPTPTSATDSSRLEEAVDCLRRLVLSNGDRSLPRADLYRSFDWIIIDSTALSDVEDMYRRAYGGTERRGPFAEPPPVPEKDKKYEKDGAFDVKKHIGHFKIGTPPPPKTQTQTTPVLKLNTNVNTSPHLIKPKPRTMPPHAPTLNTAASLGGRHDTYQGASGKGVVEVEELEIRFDAAEIATEKGNDYSHDEDGDRTPLPLRDGPLRPSMFWRRGATLSGSIDELLSPCDNSRQSQQLGPMTPNGYDDISPITRGEWGFLFKGDTWMQGTRAPVAFVQ